MHLSAIPPMVAVAASLLLVLQVRPRLFPAVALIASGVETLRAFGALHLRVPVVGAQTVLGLVILAAGVLSWVRATKKAPVTAATVLAFVGLGQVLARFL
jgi:hypothetical protein